MLKTLKNIGIVFVVLLCAALGALAGWFAREKFPPAAEPAETVTAKTFSAPMVLPEENQGIVSFLSGSGFRSRNSVWDELQPGMLIGGGDSVRTAEGGAADVQFGGLAVIRLRQNSAASFDNIKTKKRDGELSVRIIAGTVLFNVTKGAGKVTVITPDGNLSVVGTEFLVSVGENGTYTAVRDGEVAVAAEGGARIGAGFSLRTGKNAAAKPEAQSEAAKADAGELASLKMLDMPEEGPPSLARIIVEASPADAALFRNGEPCGRGSAALLAPFGAALKLKAVKAGFKSKELEIAVSGEEAEKRYRIELEADPGAAVGPLPDTELQLLMKLEARIAMLENELKSKEILYRAVSTQSSNMGTERDLLLQDAETARRETDAARVETAAAQKQIETLETRLAELQTALELEKEKVRQIQELLKE